MLLLCREGRLAVGVWSPPPPTHLTPRPLQSPCAPYAHRIPAPLTSGWAAACLTWASVRCPGTPCYYCDLYKRPPTHTLSSHYSQQSDRLPSPSSPSPPPFIYSVSSTQTAALFVCLAHPIFCYPRREAQLGKCGAFKKELPTYLLRFIVGPYFLFFG